MARPGGSMDFYDSLLVEQRDFCHRAVAEILAAEASAPMGGGEGR